FEDVCRKAELRVLPPAFVTLFFNLRKPLNRAPRERLAERVVDLVTLCMPAEGESVQIEGILGQGPEVDLFLVNRVNCPPPGRSRWNTSGILDMNPVCAGQEEINRKTTKFPSYLARCFECWLLLVA